MPSFDIVSEVDQVEIRNAVDQANKEIKNRFDFKGSDARLEINETSLIVFADDEFKLSQVKEVLTNKLTKRGIDIRCLNEQKIEKVSGNKIKQALNIQIGIEIEYAKKIIQTIKNHKVKVQASIQGDMVRVSGTKRDILQDTIALICKEITDIPLQYQNFRD